MNELKQQTTTNVIFETVTEHRGRSLEEQRLRHKQATGHNKQGKLQVREEKMKVVGAGIMPGKIIVFQECLDCSGGADQSVNVHDGIKYTKEYLENKDKRFLLEITNAFGLAGNKQTNKTKLIDTILDSC